MANRILITGSAGHLGEALIRTLRARGTEARGIDLKESEFTDVVGSIRNRALVSAAVKGCDAILHTATLHKPHVATHTRQDFVDTNITGTLNLLEEAANNNCRSVVFTSTTSTFGDAMRPKPGEPAVWVTEDLRPKPKNIYGLTKTSAEDLCSLFNRNTGLPCVVLKTSRFFPEIDDSKKQRDSFDDANLKVNELLFRRADIADMVSAHLLAVEKASDIGFDRFIISGPTPFQRNDAAELGKNAGAVLERYLPQYKTEYQRRGWKMFPSIDRVYDSSHAQQVLGWQPAYTFERALQALSNDADYRSPLTHEIGKKGYHDEVFDDGPYPVDSF
jgi:UDP-glucose 4-epimerase